MFLLESKENIGKYLKKLIKERGFEKDADFSRAYLKEKYRNIDYTEDDLNEQLKTTKSTFSQIFSGNKGITIEHLAIISKLLCVSCEEILSAGKHYAPTRNHVTNYEIARSHDRKVWDEYMKREDKLFLNCDEYRKTVIDYALEFKNYNFMKYLLEENFIWFVDNSKENYELYYYGGNIRIAKPGECCTESWIIGGAFETEEETLSYKSYIFTKTVRFLLLQSVVSQHVTKSNFVFIPDLLSYHGRYTDEQLCKMWGITEKEWMYIDSRITNIGGD